MLTDVDLALSAVPDAVTSIRVALYPADPATLVPVAGAPSVANVSDEVVLTSTPYYPLLILGAPFVINVTAARHWALVWGVAGAGAPVTWHEPLDGVAYHEPVSGTGTAVAPLASGDGGATWTVDTSGVYGALAISARKLGCGPSSTQTTSPSPTQTPSATGSATTSPSTTGTGSASPSQTRTPPSQSQTSTGSATPSGTPSTAPTPTRTPSQSPSGFPVQPIVDNTALFAHGLDGAATLNVSGAAWAGVVLYFPEVDPVCGPGAYVLTAAYLGLLLGRGNAGVVIITASLFVASPTTLRPAARVATATVKVSVGLSPVTRTLALPASFIANASSARYWALVFNATAAVEWAVSCGRRVLVGRRLCRPNHPPFSRPCRSHSTTLMATCRPTASRKRRRR